MSSTLNKQVRLRTIDMFCGAGGSSYGARNAGAEIVAGFDIWNPAIVAYKANFKGAKVYEEDLSKLVPENVKQEIGEIDLILASPECTNHSVAKGAGERSEKSKLTAFEVTRFAKVFRPKWIVIENVIQMESWSEHPKLLQELYDLNYFVKVLKLNSIDFGIAQTRNRLFLLCSQSKGVQIPTVIPKSLKPVSSIIDWSCTYKFTPLRQRKRAKKTLARAQNAIEALGKKEPFLIVYYGTGDGWQSIEKPLRTITTLDRFGLVVPTNNGHRMRMLQPEELKLAMGYGKDFNLNLDLTRRQKIMLMGNGVCPPVMQVIVNSLQETT